MVTVKGRATAGARQRALPAKAKRRAPAPKSLKKQPAKPLRKRAAPQSASGLYPPIKPYNSGMLRVSALHEIYYEESGNPRGKPAVFLHGGPGRRHRSEHAAVLRPAALPHRAVGPARLRPQPSAREPDRQHHLASGRDIESVREHLGIERWLVFGGSWGSTLALAYAQTHPDRVTELVLRGIFLLRRWELEWFYQDPGGAAALYPDLWEGICGADSGRRAQRHDPRVLPAPDQRGSRRCWRQRRQRGRSGKVRRATCSRTPITSPSSPPTPHTRPRSRASSATTSSTAASCASDDQLLTRRRIASGISRP